MVIFKCDGCEKELGREPGWDASRVPAYERLPGGGADPVSQVVLPDLGASRVQDESAYRCRKRLLCAGCKAKVDEALKGLGL